MLAFHIGAGSADTVTVSHSLALGPVDLTVAAPDTHSPLTHQTGENRRVQSQEWTLPSTRPKAGESALDVGPSDSFGADLGLSQVTEGKSTPAFPLQDDVGPVISRVEDGAPKCLAMAVLSRVTFFVDRTCTGRDGRAD
jgi:hypothetical protein